MPIGTFMKKKKCQFDGLDERAAGQQPDRAARGSDEAVDVDRLGLLPRFGEHGHDHAEDDRRGHRSGDPLDEPRTDQQPLTVGDRAQQ